jgi:hypothetical protein
LHRAILSPCSVDRNARGADDQALRRRCFEDATVRRVSR